MHIPNFYQSLASELSLSIKHVLAPMGVLASRSADAISGDPKHFSSSSNNKNCPWGVNQIILHPKSYFV
jgi:hypothetical protein